MKDKWIQFRFTILDLYYSHILRDKDCKYCRYFGGLICDHLDENDNCLGFKRFTIKDRINSYRHHRRFLKMMKALDNTKGK